MSKDLKKTCQNGKMNGHNRRLSRDNKETPGDSVANEQSLHCSDLSLQQLEFRLVRYAYNMEENFPGIPGFPAISRFSRVGVPHSNF
jgi:hypothetical protein